MLSNAVVTCCSLIYDFSFRPQLKRFRYRAQRLQMAPLCSFYYHLQIIVIPSCYEHFKQVNMTCASSSFAKSSRLPTVLLPNQFLQPPNESNISSSTSSIIRREGKRDSVVKMAKQWARRAVCWTAKNEWLLLLSNLLTFSSYIYAAHTTYRCEIVAKNLLEPDEKIHRTLFEQWMNDADMPKINCLQIGIFEYFLELALTDFTKSTANQRIADNSWGRTISDN